MPRIAGGEVDRHLAGDRCAEPVEEVAGDPFVAELCAKLLFELPARGAEEDRAPRVGDRGRDGAVAGARRGREVLAARPSRRTMQERVLVEFEVGRKIVGRRPIAEDGADSGGERLLHVEVDAAHGAVQVDLLVHEVSRVQEALERTDRRFVEGETARSDEAVAAQPLHVHRADLHAGHVRVPTNVVEVVDGEDAGEERLQDAQPSRSAWIVERWLGDEEAHPRWIDRLAVAETIPFSVLARRATEPGDDLADLSFDDQRREVLVCQALAGCATRIIRSGEPFEHLVVEEVRERTVSDVVEETGDAERFDDEPLARHRIAARAQLFGQGPVQVTGPESRFVHHAETVGEAAVLCRGEDPAGALQLTDATQSLQPRCVEQILLGGRLRQIPERRGALRRQALGQLDVAVDRIADQVHRLEAHRVGGAAAAHDPLIVRSAHAWS